MCLNPFSSHHVPLQGQLHATAPITSLFGMKMMRRMGWTPGEGLGKNKKGTLEPLLVDVKTDRRGEGKRGWGGIGGSGEREREREHGCISVCVYFMLFIVQVSVIQAACLLMFLSPSLSVCVLYTCLR